MFRSATTLCVTLRIVMLTALVLMLTVPMTPRIGIAFGQEADDAELTELSAEHLQFFESKVRPLLVDHCYECHSVASGESEGGLRVDSSAGLAAGGFRGPAVVGGDVQASLLIRAVGYQDSDMQMPPSGKLDAAEIDVLRHWVSIGAPDPRGEDAAAATLPKASPLDRDVSTHWAFNRPVSPAPPVGHDASSRDVIDQWAFEHAADSGFRPTPAASPETLVRRIHFDLTGLVPTAAQVDSFVNDSHPLAYTRLVDRLLASPEFGERFGRHWMDVARYADTVGYALAGRERRLRGSDRFRDWVISAFNRDMPYDAMIRHQLAGDRTDPDNNQGNLDAMGFLTIGRRFLNPNDTTDDRIDVITRGLLGLTVACARCHDHKFDPISAADYYALFGVLRSSRHDPDGPSPLMMRDKPNPSNVRIMLRGQPHSRGDAAPRQYIERLKEPGEGKFTDGSGRYELARRIASPSNPLTARVMVNRVWQILIGRPLVESPSDFGFRTLPPRVPQILDDLAVDFASDWSIKRLVRRIVQTRIYRQDSVADPALIRADPENRLLCRGNRRRRDFESMRDSMLAVGDLLDRRIGGPPVSIDSPTIQPRRTVYAKIDRQNLPALFRTFDTASPETHSPGRYRTTVPQQALYLMNHDHSVAIARSVVDRVRVGLRVKDLTPAIGKRSGQRNAAGRQKPDEVNAFGTAATAAVDTNPRPIPDSVLADRIFRQVLGRAPDATELVVMTRFLAVPVTPAKQRIDPRTLWSYGTARFADGRVEGFRPFPVFKAGQWQVADDFPTTGPLAYASLRAERGHPGGGTAGAVVRRWRAPVDGKLRLSGMMGHRSQKGDGVVCHILVAGKPVFSERQKSNNRPYRGIERTIHQGEWVEFVTDMNAGTNSDSFFWRANISLTGDNGDVFEADSVADFSGPFESARHAPMTRAIQLAQTLLISNEFVFVD